MARSLFWPLADMGNLPNDRFAPEPDVRSGSDLGYGSASREPYKSDLDRRPPLTPPGTTFNAVKDAGAENGTHRARIADQGFPSWAGACYAALGKEIGSQPNDRSFRC
jgi:hypothetical protein